MAEKKQSLASVGIAVLICAVVTWIFWEDVQYFMQGPDPIYLGTIGETELAAITPNRLVKIAGIADPRLQYAEASGRTYRYFILLGTKILVEQQVENARTGGELKPFKYSGEGRILRLVETLKYDALLKHFKDSLRLDLKDEGYILHHGFRPRDAWPYFGGVCLTIVVVVLSIIRHVVITRED